MCEWYILIVPYTVDATHDSSPTTALSEATWASPTYPLPSGYSIRLYQGMEALAPAEPHFVGWHCLRLVVAFKPWLDCIKLHLPGHWGRIPHLSFHFPGFKSSAPGHYGVHMLRSGVLNQSSFAFLPGATDETILIVIPTPIWIFTFMKKFWAQRICKRLQASFGQSLEATSRMQYLKGAIPHAFTRIFLTHVRLAKLILWLLS